MSFQDDAEHIITEKDEEISQLRELNAELLEACKALQMEARARNCGLRIADEAIAKAEKLNDLA